MNTTICADDELHMLNFYEAILPPRGYDVLCFTSGAEAIDAHRAAPVDLLILDIEMPGKSGIDICREIREQGDAVPIMLVSAHDSEDKIRDGLAAGADDYIVKPCKSGELLAKASALLAKRRLSNRPPQPKIPGYTLIEALGEGAMGNVFVAKDASRGADDMVAIKIAKSQHRNEAKRVEAYERFLREAKAASRVDHPNIVQIKDYGRCAGSDIPYIVMEYIAGEPLTMLNQKYSLDIRRSSEIIRQVASGLAAIHDKGICHRDIKPENIMVDSALHVKVMDFGIARLPDQITSITTHLIGTPNYIAPEAFLSSKVDFRADIFSLGVVAYEHFLGRLPFVASSIPVLANLVQHEPPEAPRTVDPHFSPALENILAGMLAKRPDDRYQSAAAIAVDLARFIDSHDDTGTLDIEEREGVWA